MITVLRVAEQLTSVNYRKWFYHRWLPPSDRSVRLVPAHTEPTALLRTPPDGPGKVAPQESPISTNMVQRLRPILRHMLGNLVPMTDQDDAVTKSPASGGDNSDRSGCGEKQAKPPWISSAERFAKSTTDTEGDPVDQSVPPDDASSMLSNHHNVSPVIPLLVTEVNDDEDISSRGDESYPYRKSSTTAPWDDRGGDTNVGEAMASRPSLSTEDNDDDDDDDDDDEDGDDDDDGDVEDGDNTEDSEKKEDDDKDEDDDQDNNDGDGDDGEGDDDRDEDDDDDDADNSSEDNDKEEDDGKDEDDNKDDDDNDDNDDDNDDADDEDDPEDAVDSDDGDDDVDDDGDDDVDDDGDDCDKEDDDDKQEDDDKDEDDDHDDDDDDEDDGDDTDDDGEEASSSPQSFGHQLSNKKESTEQEETVREIMKKVGAMMTHPSHLSGESGSEPQWMKALRIAEAMLPAQPRQPVIHHNYTPSTAGGSGTVIVQPISGPRPDLQENAERIPHQPILTPTLPRGGPWQPPKSVLALRLAQQINLPQPRHQHMPTPQPTITTKRRYMNLRRSPLDINARKRPKQASPVSIGLSGGAFAMPSPSPLPAESSFIPVLKETEFEDVLTRGQPTCLGSGVFGDVMLKRRKSGGALMAFKGLKNVDDPLKAYQEMVEEVRVMMAVQHHREFPKVLGIVNQTTFAVEFVGDAVTKQSRHLRSIVDYPPANLTVLGWIQICLDLARGLHALHHAGWSHNDLHTRNVMVWRDPNNRSDENWGAKIIDLGKATRIDNPPPPNQYDDNTKTYCFRNCIHLDPELIEGNCRRGVKTDIFSLGFVFSVVSFNRPELGVIESIYRHCNRGLNDRPTMESIIQDIEGFQSDMMKKALNIGRRRAGALA